jgi:hypothetical protein
VDGCWCYLARGAELIVGYPLRPPRRVILYSSRAASLATRAGTVRCPGPRQRGASVKLWTFGRHRTGRRRHGSLRAVAVAR